MSYIQYNCITCGKSGKCDAWHEEKIVNKTDPVITQILELTGFYKYTRRFKKKVGHNEWTDGDSE